MIFVSDAGVLELEVFPAGTWEGKMDVEQEGRLEPTKHEMAACECVQERLVPFRAELNWQELGIILFIVSFSYFPVFFVIFPSPMDYLRKPFQVSNSPCGAASVYSVRTASYILTPTSSFLCYNQRLVPWLR